MTQTLTAGWREAAWGPWPEAQHDAVAELWNSTQPPSVCFAFPHVGANTGCKIHHGTVCFHSWLACLISKIFRQEAIMSGSLENYAQLTMMLNNACVKDVLVGGVCRGGERVPWCKHSVTTA